MKALTVISLVTIAGVVSCLHFSTNFFDTAAIIFAIYWFRVSLLNSG